MLETLRAPHIRIDPQGRAWIDDTNVKVIEIVLDHIAYGWSPEEIHYQQPDISLAQIHAALGHYFDHKPEYDAEIEASLQRAEKGAQESNDSPLRRRLKRIGRLA